MLSTKPIINQIFILIFIFILTVWFQNTDDKRYQKKRITFYDKYKIPIFFSAVVGLIMNLFDIFNDNKKPLYDQEIYIEPLFA
jgi:predicted permease